jgi:hypothetical protein
MIKTNRLLGFTAIFLFLMMFSIASVSAWDLLNAKDSVNVKDGDSYLLGDREVDYKELWTKYKPIEVSTWFGLGETIFKGALVEHTETCGDNCLSEVELYLSRDGVLVEDVIFKRSFNDEKSWVDWKGFTNWNIQIENKNRYVEQDTYSYECSKTEKVSENGTAIEECSQVVTGKETIDTGEWLPYSLGSKVDAGNYKVKLVGSKKTDTILDWQFITQGKILSEWATWGRVNASLGDGLVAQYRLNDNTTTTKVVDTLGINNGTLIDAGNTTNVSIAGKINQAFNFDGVNDHITIADSTSLEPVAFSISTWVYTRPSSSIGVIVQKDGVNGYYLFVNPITTNNYSFYLGGVEIGISGRSPVDYNQWTHLAVTYNGTDVHTYKNGIFVGSEIMGSPTYSTGNLTIGNRQDKLRPFNGSIDDVRLYNRSLSETEILNIYNSGLGTEGVASAWVELQSPADGSIAYTASNNFVANAEVEGGAYLTNMSFCSNITGSWGCGDTSVLSYNATYDGTEYSSNQLFTDNFKLVKTYSINDKAVKNMSLYVKRDNTVAGGVYMWGIKYTNGTLQNKSSVVFSETEYTYKSSEFIETAKVNELYLYLGVGNTATTAFAKNITITLIEIPTSVWSKTIPAGSTLWNVQACDSDGDCGFSVANYTVSLDATAPTISINSGNGTQNYGSLTQNHTINLTATDTNLDKVWFNYNGTNTTITGAVSGVMNSTSFALVKDLYTATIYANDTAGNVQSQVVSWDYLLFQSDTIYNPTALETSSQTFRLVGQKATGVTSISARLFYDGTARTSTVATSGNNVNITNTFEIPQGSGSRNFFWEVTMVTSTGTVIINTTTQTQTVNNITFNICTVPTGLALNFTTYDTSTNLPLNSTFEATFSYYAEGGSGNVLAEYNYQNLSENRSNYLFCLNSSGLNVTLDAFVSFAATGYDRREYIIDDGTIGNFTVAIPLFLTQTILTDVVTFTIEDQNYDPIPGALVTVQRWNVGTNTYSTIGMFETDNKGQGIMDLELYNTWYRAIVSLDGQVIHTEKVRKLATTEWNILIDLEIQNPFDLFGTISKALTYDNDTQIVTYTWMDSSGYTNEGCMSVRKLTPTGYQAVYSACVETVAGSINYQFIQNGTYEVYGIIYLTAEYEGISQISDVLYITIGEDELATTVSPYGKVISLLAVGTAGFIGVSAGSPILGGILLILSLLGVSLAGWLSGVQAIIWGLITVLIVILARQTRRGA